MMRQIKCQKCNGRGGWHVRIGRFELWSQCLECLGKGRWWPGQARKRAKGK